MKNVLLVVVGVVLTVAGVIWALQGFGVIGGSFMSGDSVFAIIGPLVALLGLAIAAVGWRRRPTAEQSARAWACRRRTEPGVGVWPSAESVPAARNRGRLGCLELTA